MLKQVSSITGSIVSGITLIASLACSPLVMAEQSVDQIISKHLEARGGLEKLLAINTARLGTV